jgi:hypothetical protein
MPPAPLKNHFGYKKVNEERKTEVILSFLKII